MTKIDRFDEKIIEYLLQNGPVTNLTIAEALETSEATVRRRRTRLENAGIIKFVCAADPAKLGFHTAAIIGIEAQANKITAIEERLTELEEVQFLGLTAGGYDLMLEVWLRSSNDDIARFTTEVLANIEGVVRTDVFLMTRLSKYSGWSGMFARSD